MSLETSLNGIKCEFCVEAEYKYICPRCSRKYCSLECFKSVIHQSCSEGFYQRQVKESLPQTSNDEDKLKLIGILDKYGGEGSDWKYEAPLDYNKVEQGLQLERKDLDDKDRELTIEEEAELKQLIENATPEQLLKLMTPDERQRFEKLINSGKYEIIDE